MSVAGSINAMTTGDPEDLKNRVMSNNERLPLDREDTIKAQHPWV